MLNNMASFRRLLSYFVRPGDPPFLAGSKLTPQYSFQSLPDFEMPQSNTFTFGSSIPERRLDTAELIFGVHTPNDVNMSFNVYAYYDSLVTVSSRVAEAMGVRSEIDGLKAEVSWLKRHLQCLYSIMAVAALIAFLFRH